MAESQISITTTLYTTVHLRSPANHHFRQKLLIFLSTAETKLPLKIHKKHAISSENAILRGRTGPFPYLSWLVVVVVVVVKRQDYHGVS